jgi:putative lipase involved disintegration of autophagic bodies
VGVWVFVCGCIDSCYTCIKSLQVIEIASFVLDLVDIFKHMLQYKLYHTHRKVCTASAYAATVRCSVPTGTGRR